MIGKGAQYLTAAGFGRYRITAASLGSNLMFGSLGWLDANAKIAIMAAFGVDGTAVIAATNEYLNGIAVSDKAKATALAGFINDTPALAAYVSGWLEPDEDYPIKATSNFNTGYTTKNNTWLKHISHCESVPSGYKSLFVSGDYQHANSCYCQTYGSSRFLVSRGTSGSNEFAFGSSYAGKSYKVYITQSAFLLTQGTTTVQSLSFGSWYGYNMNLYSNDAWKWKCHQFGEGDTEVHRFLALPDGYVLDQINKNLIVPTP